MPKRIGFTLVLMTVVAACSSEIYVRDGVTDGDTFYLAPQALMDSEPVLQSWVSYSLTKSACQLQLGGDNPARRNSFDCELTARRHLTETWVAKKELDHEIHDRYLDALAETKNAGYLDEYVARYFSKKDWLIPETLQPVEFNRWRRDNLPRHQPETRIIGAWNYARNVNSAALRD